MQTAIGVAVLVVGGVLLCSGTTKLHSPGRLRRVLQQIHMPGATRIVWPIATVEVVLGAALLLSPEPPILFAGAAAYLIFAAFVVYLRLGTDVADCGCLGLRASAPSLVHVGLNGVAAAGLIAAGLAGVPSAIDVVRALSAWSAPLGIGLAASIYAAYMCAAHLSELTLSYHGPKRPPRREFAMFHIDREGEHGRA